ncbi:MAG TPA: hypothetical protein VNZ68_03030 [Rhodocyclaceae bacterium]|nr:hypothetical protein [Rhodocyclaceae bacterium]
MKKHLTHLLLAFLLLCAQSFAAAHALEHAADEGKGLPTHACELCLAGHDLGAGLGSKMATPAIVAAAWIPHAYTCSDRDALPAPEARQQSPPQA